MASSSSSAQTEEPSTRRPRVALYARISQDDSGQSLGVLRQLEDLRALAADRGWEIVEEVCDNDVSAFTGQRRPGYDLLLSLVTSGVVDRVAVWHMSRLWRDRRQRVEGLELFRAAGVAIVAVRGPDIDLSSASGRVLAGVLAEFDAYESDVKSERVARATLQRIQEGRPSGDLGYGWDRLSVGVYSVNEAEAAVIREIVARLTAGESIRAVTEDLNTRGVPAPAAGSRRYRRPGNDDGTLWGTSSVRKLATRASNCGDLIHKGRVVGKGVWPAIVPDEAHHAVCAALKRSWRRLSGNPHGVTTRRHMLSWTPQAVCGVCGGYLRSQTKKGRYGAPQQLYVCDAKGHVGRSEAAVDALTGMVVIERLNQPDLVQVLTAPEGAGEPLELEVLRGQLADALAAFELGQLSAAMLGAVESRLGPRIAELEAASTSQRAHPPMPGLTELTEGMGAEDVWANLPVAHRLAVIEVLGLTVTILPVIRRGPGFDPASIRFDWDTEGHSSS